MTNTIQELAPIESVTAALVALADGDDRSEHLSPLRIQKLLYYVQGWALGLTGLPMFADKLQAWALGPVAPDVYKKLAPFGRNGVSSQLLATLEGEFDSSLLTDEQGAHVDAVWRAYREFSAVALVEMTHRETPWIEARGQTPADEQCDAYLSEETMRTFFSEQADS